MKKLIKKILYKYLNNIYLSIDYYLNLKKINKLKKFNFESDKYKFSMYTTENFINPNWQRKETEIICLILKNCDFFVNLGANVGYYVCLASSFKVKTLAVEPDYFNLKILYKNIKLNKIQDIIILPMATYSTNSLKPIYGRGVTSSLFLNWDNTSEIDQKGFIPTFKLDDLINENTFKENNFILVDVENSELNTLLGSITLLKAKNKPAWIVEVHPNFYSKSNEPQADFTKIFELFWENEYLSYLITKEKLIQINYKNIKDILQLSLDHNHNYLFIDKKKIDKYRNILDNNI